MNEMTTEEFGKYIEKNLNDAEQQVVLQFYNDLKSKDNGLRNVVIERERLAAAIVAAVELTKIYIGE